MNQSSAENYWDEVYNGSNAVWSGQPNVHLVTAVTGLEPGRVLDLGCGEGADSVWLAQRGWQVSAVDISKVALARATQLVLSSGVADRVTLLQHDLETDFPAGLYNLVSAQYLQSHLAFKHIEVLQKAAQAVSPDGILLIVEHGSVPPWSDHADHVFSSAQETFDKLGLIRSEWEVQTIDSPSRQVIGPNSHSAIIQDNVIIVKKRN